MISPRRCSITAPPPGLAVCAAGGRRAGAGWRPVPAGARVTRSGGADPTLGVATGAQLGMTVTTLWAIPGVLASQFAALAGACLVGALVFGVCVGQAPVAGDADPGGAGGEPLLRRGQPADGDFPSRPAAKHVPVEHRDADADRLERGAAPVAAAAWRGDADACCCCGR